MEVVVDGEKPNKMMGFMMMFGLGYVPLFWLSFRTLFGIYELFPLQAKRLYTGC